MRTVVCTAQLLCCLGDPRAASGICPSETTSSPYKNAHRIADLRRRRTLRRARSQLRQLYSILVPDCEVPWAAGLHAWCTPRIVPRIGAANAKGKRATVPRRSCAAHRATHGCASSSTWHHAAPQTRVYRCKEHPVSTTNHSASCLATTCERPPDRFFASGVCLAPIAHFSSARVDLVSHPHPPRWSRRVWTAPQAVAQVSATTRTWTRALARGLGCSPARPVPARLCLRRRPPPRPLCRPPDRRRHQARLPPESRQNGRRWLLRRSHGLLPRAHRLRGRRQWRSPQPPLTRSRRPRRHKVRPARHRARRPSHHRTLSVHAMWLSPLWRAGASACLVRIRPSRASSAPAAASARCSQSSCCHTSFQWSRQTQRRRMSLTRRTPFRSKRGAYARVALTMLTGSVVFLQAMRQTRMMHMLQVLPPFSHRLRTGTEFFDLVPRHLVQDIDPHAPHTLLPLGKADVNAGPVSFAGVKFYELARAGPDARAFPRGRPRAGMPGAIPGAAPGAVGAPGPGSTPGAYPGTQSPARPPFRPPTPSGGPPGASPAISVARPPANGPGAPSPSPAPARPTTGSPTASTVPGASPPPRPLGQPRPAGQGPSAPGVAPGPQQAPSAPQGQMPRPTQPVDTSLVAALEEHVEHKPQLLQLLHLARTGQITGKQLPQMNAIIASTARAAPTAPRPAMPHVPERRTGPPVLLVEFPENASVNFLLPLWSSVVERREAEQRSVALSFFAPAIGSKAAGDSGRDQPVPRKNGQPNGVTPAGGSSAKAESGTPPVQGPQPAPSAGGQAEPSRSSAPAGATPPASRLDSRSTPRSAPPKRSLRSAKGDTTSKASAETPPPAPAPAKRTPTRAHELFPVTWHISNMDTRLWECIARVPGCVTSIRGAEPSAERRFASDKDREVFEDRVQRFRTMYAEIPTLYRLPQQVQSKDVPAGLEDHVTDRYAVRIMASTARPQPKRKVAAISENRGVGLGPVRNESGTAPSTHARQAEGERPPKRKRHVATHNPDGSIKSCGACGKTKTPMWRRGPLGPSQLCNACGAKWKAGRLVVPDVPPPPILDDVLPVRPVAKAKLAQTQGPPTGPGAPGPQASAGPAPMPAQAPTGAPAVAQPRLGPGAAQDGAAQGSAAALQTSGAAPAGGPGLAGAAAPSGAAPPSSAAPLSGAALPSNAPPPSGGAPSSPTPAAGATAAISVGAQPAAEAERVPAPGKEEPDPAHTSAPPSQATWPAQPPPAPAPGQ